PEHRAEAIDGIARVRRRFDARRIAQDAETFFRQREKDVVLAREVAVDGRRTVFDALGDLANRHVGVALAHKEVAGRVQNGAADAVRNLTLQPQFSALKIARVAATTESAPFIPQAHVTICGARAFSRRMPAGIGIPSTMPIGTSVAAAMRIRMPREKGIAHVT